MVFMHKSKQSGCTQYHHKHFTNTLLLHVTKGKVISSEKRITTVRVPESEESYQDLDHVHVDGREKGKGTKKTSH